MGDVNRGPIVVVPDELLAGDPPPTDAERAEEQALIAHMIAANMPEPEPIKAPTAEEILALIEAASKLLPTGPVAARVEVGHAAHASLCRAINSPPTWMPAPPFAMGLVIVENYSLRPERWRVIDRDGNVMREGTL